ncbi:MAG TPA: DUF4038 domain-containing protein [Gemmatimonadaceae bacterium]|nr:DUF4038 domain-containing protein [Gemmatimonadaceae bacterium]
MLPVRVTFSQSSPTTSVYDFVEITAEVGFPRAANPFTDAELSGWFETADGRTRWQVLGFCDDPDGGRFRIRFTPPAAGEYRYTVEYRQGGATKSSRGTFRAIAGRARGPIRVDPAHPWHFVWEGTGEHYFFNGTTAYWLFGWKDDDVITASLERLHRLKINRVRVTIAGRSNVFFGEPIMVHLPWTLYVTPWPATKPEDVYHPGFDYARFDVAYWQKIERGLRFARDRDMIVSLVLDMNDSRVHPAAGSDDERRFIRYAVARLAAFSNVTWDLGDDLDGYRDNAWAEATGRLLKQWDPYHHLTTTHPRTGKASDNQVRQSDWVDFTSFQNWSRTQHAYMLEQRGVQRALGRIIPQTNEEYGYEDHYPLWSPPPDAEAPDVLRRMAWEISMAGGYQTTGETAKRGTNVWPNTGGGWVNGRGDSTMTMLVGYAHMIDFFTDFDWWSTDPHDELVDAGSYCLADPGRTYAIYLPHASRTTVRLLKGRYRAQWFDPSSGRWSELPVVDGGSWTSPVVPDSSHDWAILLRRER